MRTILAQSYYTQHPIPEPHFHSEHTTIHLPKIQKVVNPHELFSKLDYLLASTLKPRKLALWEAQQTFVNVFQSLEYDQNNKDSSSKLAEQIEIYLKQNYKNTITNKDLETHFHVHQNYLARCMKVAFQRTPLEYLMDYRLDQGRSLCCKLTGLSNKLPRKQDSPKQAISPNALKKSSECLQRITDNNTGSQSIECLHRLYIPFTFSLYPFDILALYWVGYIIFTSEKGHTYEVN